MIFRRWKSSFNRVEFLRSRERERERENRRTKGREGDDYNKRCVHHGPPAKINERPGRETMKTEFQWLLERKKKKKRWRAALRGQERREALFSSPLPSFSKVGTWVSAKHRLEAGAVARAGKVLMKGEAIDPIRYWVSRFDLRPSSGRASR